MKLAIFDKDGTLTIPASGEQFVQDPHDQKPIPGMLSVLDYFDKNNYTIAVASNQLGIKYNYKTEDETIEEFLFLATIYPQIDYMIFCPDEGESAISIDFKRATQTTRLCDTSVSYHFRGNYLPQFEKFRKPNSGMLQYLIRKFEVKPTEDCFYCGDRQEDFLAAKDLELPFFWAKFVWEQKNESN